MCVQIHCTTNSKATDYFALNCQQSIGGFNYTVALCCIHFRVLLSWACFVCVSHSPCMPSLCVEQAQGVSLTICEVYSLHHVSLTLVFSLTQPRGGNGSKRLYVQVWPCFWQPVAVPWAVSSHGSCQGALMFWPRERMWAKGAVRAMMSLATWLMCESWHW